MTDEQIESYAKAKYPITFMDKGQAICDKQNFHDAVIYGAKWMRDKLPHPQLDTTKEAEKDIVCQHDFELLNDTGVQKCKDCGKLK